jgi:hypothetical protein
VSDVWLLFCDYAGAGSRGDVWGVFDSSDAAIRWLRKSLPHNSAYGMDRTIVPTSERDGHIRLTQEFYLERMEMNPKPLRAPGPDDVGATA